MKKKDVTALKYSIASGRLVSEALALEAELENAAEKQYSVRGLRWVLIAGFAAIGLIFLGATIDAVRLLGSMRSENQILREQALARTNHLASIRSSILLTYAYLDDADLNQNTERDLAKVQGIWERMQADLGQYQSSSPDENALVKHVADMLEEDWQGFSSNMRSPKVSGRYALIPQASIIEITTQLANIDAMQEAATEAKIEDQFQRLSGRLRTVLTIALAAALILAIGCLIYISRIERQNRARYEEIANGRKALEQLSARMVDAQENERRAISRELHDQVGQTLNALLVDAANLAKRIQPDDETSRRYLDNIRTFADSSVNSIRDIALLLRPSMLDDLGLIPALEWQAREVSRRTGIKVDVTAENVPDSLPDGVRTCVYRVVQEALANVSRHSGAKCAVGTVRADRGKLSLSVTDDGQGFDPLRTRGLGMLGMEERIRQLRGRLDVQSAPGKGTTVHATLPVSVPAVAAIG